MKVKEIYEYEYDTLSENLTIEFSLKGDNSDSYRALELSNFEVLESVTSPFLLDEYSLEELMEEEDFVLDILQYYIENNPDEIPPEEYL